MNGNYALLCFFLIVQEHVQYNGSDVNLPVAKLLAGASSAAGFFLLLSRGGANARRSE